MAAAILMTGRRTVANLLRTVGDLAPGSPASYRRVLSSSEWSGLELGCALARLLLTHLIPAGPVRLVGDDTVDGHPGRTVYGKGRHRDAVRSTHSYTAWRYEYRWVVPAVLIQFPFATRPWARPVLIDLYRPEGDERARKRPHRTGPARIMCGLLRLVRIRSPGRAFVFAGDSGYGTHDVARFCHRHRRRPTPVREFHPDANRFDPPPPYAGTGRPSPPPPPYQVTASLARAAVAAARRGFGARPSPEGGRSQCRPFPYTVRPGCPSTVSSPTSRTGPAGTRRSSRNRAEAPPTASPDHGPRESARRYAVGWPGARWRRVRRRLATVRRPAVSTAPTRRAESR
jgi:hypothetical protein